MDAILEALSESRYGMTIGAGLVVLVLLLIYAIVSKLGGNKKDKQAGKGGPASSIGGMGAAGDGGVKYYKDGTPMPQDNDSGEYRDSDLYGIKGDKKDKEEFYKDWD